MKVKIIFLILILTALILAGCSRKKPGSDGGNTGGTTPTPTAVPPTPTAAPPTPTAVPPTPTTAPVDSADGVSTASIVNNADAFVSAIGPNGTWIIAALNDLTVDRDLVLTGEFTNGKKDDAGKDIIQRKIALYTQDENKNITARFTLTAPKLTIESPNSSIQHGTFKGDIYAGASNFQLVDATVDGNMYFMNADAQSSFKMDATSSITGKQELMKQ